MNFIMVHKSKIIVTLLVIATLMIAFNRGKEFAIQEEVKQKNEFKLLPPKPLKSPTTCTTNEVEYILKSNDKLLDGMDLLLLDLSTFELFKTKRIDDNRVGYYYRRSGKVKEYYTVFKNEPKNTPL